MSKQFSLFKYFKKTENSGNMNECAPSTSSESTKSPPESKLLDSSEEELNKKYNESSTFALNDPGHGINAIDITVGPYQPVVDFPTIKIGGKSRSFKAKWYKEFPWLEYSKKLDAAFCFPCRFFLKTNQEKEKIILH